MTTKISILIVDDEESVRDSLYNWFIEDGYFVETAENAKEALSILETKNFDIILADLKMPGMDGLEMQRRIKALNKETIIIIMTAFASVDSAVRALKDGAYDYITKPFDPDDLSHLIRNATSQIILKAENEALKKKVVSLENIDDIIGNSEAIRKVLKEVESVAQSNSSVIIVGESGTGKELIARAIHSNSPRKFFPMVSVVPPLRERTEDIPLLVDYFIKKYCTSMSRDMISIDPSALKRMEEFEFPGNVRELENMIERAIVIGNGKEIHLKDLPLGKEIVSTSVESLDDHEKKHILQILNKYNWNISHSAKVLKVDRVTLYNKIKKYDLKPID